MGIPLTMEPDYETFACKFSFGKAPLQQEVDEVFATACFAQCPSKGSLRAAHAPQGCDALMQDSTYDPRVPPPEVFWAGVKDMFGLSPKSK
mmetsp:Transcript_39346/g.92616  ORF Transcript_39346/g.92616 Transcript_39346/m.92616 type:complete len:91 (+) Transcript_39346:46-318(+)